MVQKLWTAINFIRSQKQVANTERIERYMQREYNVTPDEIERQLNFAVADRLISVYRAVANKGNNPGSEQDGYRVQPADENEVCSFVTKTETKDGACFLICTYCFYLQYFI